MAVIIPIKPANLTGENKCSHCKNSSCCTYLTQHIPTPRSLADFDQLLWQVSHQGIRAFKDSDGWFLQIVRRCNHLQTDGGCGIYLSRPRICRDHSTDNCEFDGLTVDDFELFFDDYPSLLKYCRKRFRRWDQRFKHNPKQE